MQMGREEGDLEIIWSLVGKGAHSHFVGENSLVAGHGEMVSTGVDRQRGLELRNKSAVPTLSAAALVLVHVLLGSAQCCLFHPSWKGHAKMQEVCKASPWLKFCFMKKGHSSV